MSSWQDKKIASDAQARKGWICIESTVHIVGKMQTSVWLP
jgi:hypothetical protein